MDEITAIKEGLTFDADVILFGSRARGDFYPDSDWDIAVISEAFAGKDILERRRMVSPVIRNVLQGESVDIVCYTPEEYDKGKDSFLPSLIEKEGIKA